MHELEEVQDVPRVERAGVERYGGGEVGRSENHADAVRDDLLARLGELAVAALRSREVDDHRAGDACARTIAVGDEDRRPLAGDLSRRDDDVGDGHPFGDDLALLALGTRA